MALHNAAPMAWQAQGCSDAADSSLAFDGAMAALTNLIPNPAMAGTLVPRPADVQLSNFSGFTTPAQVEALLVIGDLAWGLVASARFVGKSEPFCYDLVNGVFLTIANVTAANCPATLASGGEWVPPCMAQITNGRIMITDVGYDGVTNFLGWIDTSSASITTLTGTTHTSTLIDTLSSNPINAGYQVGMKVAGAGIPANTYIVKMDAASITLSQATTASAAGVALTVTGGSPAAPLYGAGNLNGNPLVGVTTCVSGYSGRAWYGYKNYAIYSDTLNPTQVTAAAQALQIGDSLPVTALAGLPLTSQVNGGTLQSLIVFKGAGPFTQVTGDAALTTLATNQVNGSVGTLSPNSIVATPAGLTYIAPDGLRTLGLDGVVRPPVGTKGRGVARLFQLAQAPSRICAAYNDQVIRISSPNPLVAGTPTQEWWYHLDMDKWTGPHSFPAAQIEPYFGTACGPFVKAPSSLNATLFNSYVETPLSPTYTENGVVLTWNWLTLLTPDNGAGAMNNVGPQGTLATALPGGAALTIALMDETGAALDTVALSGSVAGANNWNAFNWGTGVWGYTVAPYQQVAVNWTKPEVFKQAQIQINGAAQQGLVLGPLRGFVQTLGYDIK